MFKVAGFLGWMLMASAAQAAEHYDCPYLDDPNRRTLAPMSQGKDGWFFRSADVIEDYAIQPEALAYLARLSDAFAAREEKLVLLAVPPRSFSAAKMLDATQPMQDLFDITEARRSYAGYLESLKGAGLAVVEPGERLLQRDTKTGMAFYFKRDVHWTPFGARLAAEALAEVMRGDPAYATLAHYQFQTRQGEALQSKRTKIVAELRALCSDTIPAEKVPEYSTQREDSADAQALFGDADESPAIVLLGSSFSAVPMYHFEGFLAQASGLEVANFAMSGGQLYNAMVSYLSLPEAERLAPRYIVWEALAHYDFNHGMQMFRQMIPAVGGECSAQDALAEASLPVKQGKGGLLLQLPEEQDIHGPGYFLFLHSDNKALARFTLQLDYADGDGEWFPVDRTEHFTNTGRFFVELSDELHAPLTRVSIDGLSQTDAQLRVRLCRYTKTGEDV